MNDMLPALDYLLRKWPVPTLAEISDASMRARRAANCDNHQRVWSKFDKTFKTFGVNPPRWDYRLWRLFYERECLSAGQEKTWGDPLTIAIAALEENDPIISWSTFTLLAGIISRTSGPDGAPEFTTLQKRLLADIAKSKLDNSVEAVPEARAGCTAIEIAIRCAIQRIHYETLDGDPLSFGDAKQHIDKLHELFPRLDPDWEPGNALGLKELTTQGTDKRHVLVISPFVYATRIPGFFFRGREAARNGSLSAGPSDNNAKLLADGLGFAMSAYQSACSLRCSHVKNRSFARKFDYNWLVEDENRNLVQACLASRDAGNHLWQAKLSHWLLWTLPHWLRSKGVATCIGEYKFDDIATRLAGCVREVGLTVPDWALPQKEVGTKAPANVEIVDGGPSGPEAKGDMHQPDEQGRATNRSEIHAGSANHKRDPYQKRLAQEWETEEHWKKLRGFAPDVKDPDAMFKTVLGKIKQSQQIPTSVLESAFALNLKHEKLNSAMDLVAAGFKPNRTGVLDLAHKLNRVQQEVWYGLDFDVQEKWRKALKAAWYMNRAENFSFDETLALHEVLSGRLSSMMVSKGDEAAKLLLDRMVEETDDDEIGFRMSSNREFRLRGPGVFNLDRLAQTVDSLRNSGLGRPVFVSLVAMSENQWSLLASDGREPKRPDDLPIEADVETESANDCLSNALFYLADAAKKDELEWDWPEGLRSLTRSVVKLAKEVTADVRWIVLAVDQALKDLPWQLLVREVDRQIIVSEVPSLGWTGLIQNPYRKRNYRPGVNFQHGIEPDLEGLVAVVQGDMERLKAALRSATCVVAHGRVSEGFPQVKVNGKALTAADYCELCQRCLVIFHSCWSGAPHDGVLGDYGGLATCALGNGCRLLCAPAVEIPPWVAMKLHEKIVEPSGPAEFGLRYLAAINEYPAVGLYKIFGLPNERLFEQSDILSQ